MKSSTCKPSQEGKPALPVLYPTKVAARHRVSLPVQPFPDAWLCQPVQREPENYLHILRNRRN